MLKAHYLRTFWASCETPTLLKATGKQVYLSEQVLVCSYRMTTHLSNQMLAYHWLERAAIEVLQDHLTTHVLLWLSVSRAPTSHSTANFIYGAKPPLLLPTNRQAVSL